MGAVGPLTDEYVYAVAPAADAPYGAVQTRTEAFLTFHQPGKHNQKDHAPGRALTVAEAGELATLRDFRKSRLTRQGWSSQDPTISKQYKQLADLTRREKEYGVEAAAPKGKADTFKPASDTEMTKAYGGWSKALTPGEKSGLSAYAGGKVMIQGEMAHDVINASLRGSKRPEVNLPGMKAEAKKYVPAIDAAIAKGSVPADTVAYRGFMKPPSGLKPGGTFTDKGYVSMSLSEEWAGNFGPVMPVRIPKGTKAGYIDAMTPGHGEQELVLPRGSTFRLRDDGSLEVVS